MLTSFQLPVSASVSLGEVSNIAHASRELTLFRATLHWRPAGVMVNTHLPYPSVYISEACVLHHFLKSLCRSELLSPALVTAVIMLPLLGVWLSCLTSPSLAIASSASHVNFAHVDSFPRISLGMLHTARVVLFFAATSF